MRFNITDRWRGLMISSALWAFTGVSPAIAQAASEQNDTAALRAQVLHLTTLVQALSEQDQQQISALKAQVLALQARLDQAQASGETAEPRSAQTAASQVGIQQIPTPQEAAVAQPRVVQNSQHRLAFESADGRYTIGLTGVIQFDAGDYLDLRPASALSGPQELSNGVNARRARIGVTGTADQFAFAFVCVNRRGKLTP